MSSSDIPWLPDQDIYLEKSTAPHVRSSRPWNQGDIFDDVPIILSKRKDGEPQSKILRGAAMLIGHPCSVRGGTSLAVFQNVCQVRVATAKEVEALSSAWDRYLQLFPLPRFRNDELWVADFNLLGTVIRDHLYNQRIVCLNHLGWAAFQRRYATHSLRIDQPLEKRLEDTRSLWNEIEIWEEWCERGHAEADYPLWLKEPIASGHDAGTTRRNALGFAPDAVRDELPDARPSEAS